MAPLPATAQASGGPLSVLDAPAGGAAVGAAVAGAAADHDGAAFVAGGGVGLVFERELVLFGDGGAGDDFLLGDGDGAGRGAVSGDDADGLFLLCSHEFGAEPFE